MQVQKMYAAVDRSLLAEKWRKSGAIIGFKERETTIPITARQGRARQMRPVIDSIELRF